MRRSSWAVTLLVAAGLVAGAAAGVRAAADEKKMEKPAAGAGAAKKEKAAAAPKPVRLVKPWSGLSSLSEEQRTQIAEIHRKAVEEVKQVQQREKDAIMAVLTDDQKSELNAMMEKETTERKMKAGAKKAADGEAAKPAAD